MPQTKQLDRDSTVESSHSPTQARGSVAGFDFEADNQRYLTAQSNGASAAPVNQAKPYGVSVLPANVATGQTYWKVIGVRHLTGSENRGRHNAFIEALDEQGKRVNNPNMRVGWIWEGKSDGPADPKRLDKPANEPAADIPIEKTMTVTLWLEGDGPSDQVQGLHTRHDDEEEGNTRGHHSYYIVFQRGEKRTVAVDTTEEADDDATDNDLTGNNGGNNGTHGGPSDTPAGGSAVRSGKLKMGHRRSIRAKEKFGIDANAPILADGRLAEQVANPRILAETGVGWVRLNFIHGPWHGPDDTTKHHGRTWLEAYRTIVRGLRNEGLQIYGLVGHEILNEAPGDQFRDGVDGPISNSWISKYADRFARVAELFHNDVAYFETFNEPDDWNDPDRRWKRNWIHPTWLAVMLQAVHDRVRANSVLQEIKIISGPVEGFDVNDNAGVRYLEQVYHFGKQTLGWGRADTPIPFDGIGYHLYIAEGERHNVGAALREKYGRYMAEMRALIHREDPGTPIFVSEIGWRNDGGLDGQQRAALEATVAAIVDDDQVALGFWFCTQDFPGKPYGVYGAGGFSPTQRKPIHDVLHQHCARQVDAAVAVTTKASAVAGTDSGLHALGTPQPDVATYVPESDLIKDYTVLPAGLPFAQSWSMTNIGATTWGVGYKLRHVDGFRMGAPTAVAIPACAPGETVAITVPFVAPQEAGTYMSTWQLCNADGQPFGQRVWTVINIAALRDFVAMPGATSRGMAYEPTARRGADALARAPIPISPVPGKPLSEADPELYAAWRDHMRRGFENNQTMFEQVLAGFMNPYWSTVWMYRILFGVGVTAFVVAVVMAYLGLGAPTTAIFGGLSVVSFIGYFLNRPLQALEENLQFITWLGVIYNSYWTRLAYTSDLTTVQAELEDATNDTIAKINELMDKHTERNANRPVIGR